MGQFTQVEIIIECHTDEDAKELKASLDKAEEQVQEMHDETVGLSIGEVSVDNTTVRVDLHSERYPNAEWQVEQILELCKRKHKALIEEFTADDVTATNMVYETDWDD